VPFEIVGGLISAFFGVISSVFFAFVELVGGSVFAAVAILGLIFFGVVSGGAKLVKH